MRSFPLRALTLSLASFLALGGCAIGETSLGRLAAYDLECPVEQLTITEDAAFSKTYQGCGREVSYVRSSGGSSPMSVPRGADAWRVRVAAD